MIVEQPVDEQFQWPWNAWQASWRCLSSSSSNASHADQQSKAEDRGCLGNRGRRGLADFQPGVTRGAGFFVFLPLAVVALFVAPGNQHFDLFELVRVLQCS